VNSYKKNAPPELAPAPRNALRQGADPLIDSWAKRIKVIFKARITDNSSTIAKIRNAEDGL